MIASAHNSLHSILALAIITPIELAVFVRILLRPHRDPASRIAWIVVVGVLPLFGILAYLLLGEVNIGRGRVKRLDAVLKGLQTGIAYTNNDCANAPLKGGNPATDGPPHKVVGQDLAITPGSEVTGGKEIAGSYIRYAPVGNGFVFVFGSLVAMWPDAVEQRKLADRYAAVPV